MWIVNWQVQSLDSDVINVTLIIFSWNVHNSHASNHHGILCTCIVISAILMHL